MIEFVESSATLLLLSRISFCLGLLIEAGVLVWVINRYKDRKWWGLLISWLGLGAATAFFLWVITSSPAEMRQLDAGLSRYGFFVLLGMAMSGMAAVIMRLNGVQHELTVVSHASCVVYFSFLKVLGWNFIPWLLVTLTIPLFLYLRKSASKAGSSALLLQSMGTLSGLYMSLHLHDFISGWVPFQEVVAGMWLLITGITG